MPAGMNPSPTAMAITSMRGSRRIKVDTGSDMDPWRVPHIPPGEAEGHELTGATSLCNVFYCINSLHIAATVC